MQIRKIKYIIFLQFTNARDFKVQIYFQKKKKTYFGVKFEKDSIGRRCTAKSYQIKKYLGYTLFLKKKTLIFSASVLLNFFMN